MVSIDHFEVRALREGGKDALLVFLKQVYQSPVKQTRSHWEWQYSRNPLLSSTGYVTLVCWDGNKVAGQRPLMPLRLWLKGQLFTAAWAPDFMVHPDYRGRGVGSRLVQAALKLNYIYIAIDSAKPTLGIYEKADVIRLPDVSSFFYPHRIGPFLKRRIRLPVVGSFLAGIGDMAAAIRSAVYAKSKSVEFDIVDIDRFDCRFDDLWNSSHLDNLVVAERSSQFLKWRFQQSPGNTYKIIGAVSNGSLIGYLVWRQFSLGRFLISDIWSKRLDLVVLEALIRECIRRNQACRDSEFTRIDGSHPVLKNALLSCGFIRSGGKTFVVHPANSRVDREALTQGDAWYVTAFDSDIDPVFH